MKKYKKALTCAVMILCLISFAACTAENKETEKDTENIENTETSGTDYSFYEEKTREFLELLFAGDIKKASGFDFGEELQKYIDDGLLEELMGYESEIGAFEEIADVKITETQGYYGATALCMFEKYEITFVLSFDQDGAMVGFFQQTPIERSGAEEILPPAGITEEDLTLVIDAEHELGGTLSIPKGEGPFPAVVLVHGSGNNNRNEKIMSNTPFRDIAWSLSSQGIAVYRYDKRSYVYEDAHTEAGFSLYEETVQDAGLAVELLRSLDNVDSTHVYVAGHSLGGMALPLIHQECEAAGYIMLAGPGRAMDVLMKEQYEFLFSLEEAPGDTVKEYYDTALAEVDKLSKLEDMDNDELLMGQTVYYWKSIQSYNQIAEAERIDRPVLVLQGEEDYQVTMEDFQLWQDTFKNTDNWSFKSYPGLTHLFTGGHKENGPADYATRQDVNSEVINDMAAFILDLSR